MLSQAFVRVGCFLAGCCYGKPTNLCWGVRFKTVDNLLRHPTQIYEAVLFFAIYFVTRAVYKKDSRLSGRTFYTALLLYGSGRFFIEFFRVDSPALFMGITFAQYTCLLLAIITAIEIMPKNH
jgi:phosphatidylglycerol:prolipoprotein diacylglycerol transferase